MTRRTLTGRPYLWRQRLPSSRPARGKFHRPRDAAPGNDSATRALWRRAWSDAARLGIADENLRVSIDRQVWNVRKGEDGSGIEEVPYDPQADSRGVDGGSDWHACSSSRRWRSARWWR